MNLTQDGVVRRRRVARKAHTCGRGIACSGAGRIRVDDVYAESTEYPGGEAGYADAAGHPVRMAVCARCVQATGDHLLLSLDPVPYEQLCRDGLL